MKKVLALIISVLMLTTSTAFAQLEFVNEIVKNYTQESVFKFSFRSAKDIVSLLKEVGENGEMELFVDVEKLLSTLLSGESSAVVQLDISEDLKKGEIGVTGGSAQSVDVNKNLSVSYSAKSGVWISYDFTDETNPKIRLIYTGPFHNKYIVTDIDEILSEKEKFALNGIVQKFLNAEFIGTINSKITECVEKNSIVKLNNDEVTISMDNAGFIKLIKETLQLFMNEIFPEIPDFDEEDIEEIFSSLFENNIRILGENGIVIKYTLINGKISKISTDVDICISIPEIQKAVTGEEWKYISEGKIEFTACSEERIFNTGTTKVQFPVVDENNAISFEEMNKLLYGDYEADYEYEISYPYTYVGQSCEKLPVINGKYYFPLRKTLEDAYDDTVKIAFDNGTITLSSEYFNGFTNATLVNGSSKMYTDLQEYEIGVVFIDETGTAYVSRDFFENVLGWELQRINHELLQDSYHYSFYTSKYE